MIERSGGVVLRMVKETMFLKILAYVSTFTVVVGIAGYINYWSGKADTWEQGVKNVFMGLGKAGRWIYDAFYEEFAGEPPNNKKVEMQNVLPPEEQQELVKRFENFPYVLPRLEDYNMNFKGCARIDISAMGFAPAYKNLDGKGLAQMCLRIIEGYYSETRGIYPYMAVMVATPTRLVVVVPLSIQAKDMLKKKIEEQRQKALEAQEEIQQKHTVLEEEIPVQKETTEEGKSEYETRI